MDRFTVGSPAIDRALDIFAETDEDAANRASMSLYELLRPVRESIWPEVSDSFSRLTGSGFPMELTFSSGTNAISYTTELEGPEVAESQRLRSAGSFLEKHMKSPESSGIGNIVNRLAAQPDLLFGGWVGGRHSAAGEDRFKIYMEVGRAAQNLGAAFPVTFLLDPKNWFYPHAKMRMVSTDNNGKTEYYFRLNDLDTWELRYLMASLDFKEQGSKLLDFIEKSGKRKIDRSFIGDNLGFSLMFDKTGEVAGISVFTFNYKIFEPNDQRIRIRVLNLADHFGWDFASYERISEPLESGWGKQTCHGMVAFSVGKAGDPVFQIGLRPPGKTSFST